MSRGLAYPHRIIPTGILVLGLYAFDASSAHLPVATDVCVWELAVLFDYYCYCKECETYCNY